MAWPRAIVKFVDRDVARWGGRSMMLVLCALPILLLDLAFDGPPAEAPQILLIAALALSAFLAGFVLWREARFAWREWRQIQELAELEAFEEKRDG